MEGDRFFNDMNEATLGLFLGGRAGLELVHLWITEDLRNYARGYQNVLNAWYAGMQFQKAQAKRPPMLLASVNVGGLDAGLTSHRRRAPATPPRSDPSSGSQNQRPALDRNR
jgi:hypothetical protein